MVCNGAGNDVNEIIPRARGKASLDWKNKVLMCRKCHSEFHSHGVSKKVIREMQEKRIQFLSAMGREAYL